MKKSPCFPFYPSDFFGDVKVRVMSGDAKAYYLLLLSNIWEYDTQYSIPDEPDLLCKLLELDRHRFDILIAEIRPCFLVVKGRLVSKRLKQEKEKQDNYRKQQSEKGRRSAEQRSSRGSTVVQPDTQPKGNSSNPISNPKPKLKREEKKEKKGAAPFVLPDWVDAASWDHFLEFRKKKGPFTEWAKHLIVIELDKLRKNGHDPTDVLNQSVARGWTDVYPLKEKGGNNGAGRGNSGRPNPSTEKAGRAQSDGADYPTDHEF